MISRRGFIGGLLAAPAIVQVANLMPVKVGAESISDFGSGDYTVSYWMRHDSGRWQFVEFALPSGPVDDLTIRRRG